MTFLCVLALSLSILGTDGQGSSQIPVAAFTKGQTTHLHLTQGEIINYNKLISKVDANIDDNGVFHATQQGLYAFHFYSLTRLNTELWMELYKNTELICSAYAHTPSQAGYADAGNSALLYLNPGDTVYVKAHDAYDTTLYGVPDEIYSTFTGVLLDSGFFEHEGFDRTVPHGFSVGLTQNLTISDGGKVAYDKDFNNNAAMAGYNITTNDFIAPVDGLYIFHFHALSTADMEVYLELFKNQQYIISAYAYTTNEYGDAGNSVILPLSKNDDVTIKARPNYDVELLGTPSEIYCTFSGSLLSMTVPGNTGDGAGGISEVAFSVALSHNVNITALSKVPWDRQFINYGSQFDMRTGIFTPKISGVYVFHFHGLSETGEELYLELVHNAEYIVSAYAYVGNSYAAGSNTATLKLIAGDQVFVRTQGETILYGANDEIYCSFSGYLVAPFSESQPIVG
ncbi:complement C1q tumor necrosis factor-related protein 4-like [Argopecten irradians]|uniref:complement C1q tumor necrosis factor-related protein 4-like n=1 Tax=Argopecten irradians TaxID=31199 RepID=UPI003716EB32